ncbi:Hypothetical protein NocV09_01501950 [Nannochloropsis oceanica]
MYCPGYPTLAKALGFLEKHKVLEVFFKTRQLEIKSLHGRFMAQKENTHCRLNESVSDKQVAYVLAKTECYVRRLCHGFVLQTSENKWRWPNNPNWSSMMYKRHRDVVHKDRSTFADVDYDVWELKK